MSKASHWTPVSEIGSHVAAVKKSFDEGKTRSPSWRKEQLRRFQKMLKENESEWLAAVNADLRMNPLTAKAEIIVPDLDIIAALKNLDDWMKPEYCSAPVAFQPATAKMIREPKGVVLIIAPWNYPTSMVTRPLVGAIAAGNSVIIKPSEVSENTSQLIAKLFPKYFDQSCIRVVSGGVEETTELLKHKFDHIIYTGNGVVGKIVMHAAANHLTPVTLELGGKSPLIIDKDVNLSRAVPRIVFGKWNNLGQTCIAPDYALVHEAVYDQFLAEMVRVIKQFFGSDPKTSKDYGKLITQRHTQRVAKLLEGQEAYYGGDVDVNACYISPTLLVNVQPDSPVMQEEIFGPILPVLKIKSTHDAIPFINSRAKPLALYIFSSNNDLIQKVLDNTTSGGSCVNDVLLHCVTQSLPFGGVGESGLGGGYNGKHSFELFSHKRGVLQRPFVPDPSLRFPPFTKSAVDWFVRFSYITLPSISPSKVIIAVLLVALFFDKIIKFSA